MKEITTVRLTKKTRAAVDKFRIHPRETIEDIIKRLVKKAK